MSLSKRSKIAFLIVITAIIGGYLAYKYTYKAHKTIDELEVKFSGAAKAFSDKVQQDALLWQDVIVELEGVVTSIDNKGFMLNDNVYCQLDENVSVTDVKEGQTIKIKGRMIGYDDLLEELKLDQAKIIK